MMFLFYVQVMSIQLDDDESLNDSVLTDETKASSLPKEFTGPRRTSQTYFYTSEDGQLFPRPYEGEDSRLW